MLTFFTFCDEVHLIISVAGLSFSTCPYLAILWTRFPKNNKDKDNP